MPRRPAKTTRAVTIGALAIGLLTGVCAGAQAQNPQTGTPGQTPPPVTPRGPTTTPPEQVAPKSDGSTTSGTLSRSGGTLTPPAVDPGMTRTPPATSSGAMPVIPPPGTPGGNTSVVPK